MEAGNLGAWMSSYSEGDLDLAIELLCPAPTYRTPGWFDTAISVRNRFPSQQQSLGVPTWFYGHEPSNLFASHIGKYFANSIREDGLLSLSLAGVIYAKGSAGTIQEIFQDACQNHYGTCQYVSSMIFFGRAHWAEATPIFPLLQSLAKGREYEQWLHCTDDVEGVVHFLKNHPPQHFPAK